MYFSVRLKYKKYLKSKIIRANGQNVKVVLKDSAGQERYKAITKPLYRNAKGVILVCDITNKQSVQDLPKWEEEALVNGPVGMQFVVVANKCDLASGNSGFESLAKEWAEKKNYAFFITSAKTQKNLEAAFNTIIKLVVQNTPEMTTDGHQSFKISPTRKGNDCCS